MSSNIKNLTVLISTLILFFGCDKDMRSPSSGVFFIDDSNGIIMYDGNPYEMPDKYPVIKEVERKPFRKPYDRSPLDNMPVISVDPNAFPMIIIPFDPNLYPMKILP
jgi:hypothetical protein